MELASWIKKHNVEIQFWGYESGNILAAVSGVGGFIAVYRSFTLVGSETDSNVSGLAFLIDMLTSVFVNLFTTFPDLAVTVCIGLIVLISPLLRIAIRKIGSGPILVLYDYGVVLLAIAVLVFALRADTSWITVSGSSFVVAAAFLRYGLRNPLFLKIGGLFLQVGGFALGMFGITLASHAVDQLEFILGGLTVLTGYYVLAAGVLTYVGGIFQTDEYEDNVAGHQTVVPTNSYTKLFHPKSGLVSKAVARLFDYPCAGIAKYVVNPSIFWVGRETKATKPFITSMAARLPWRLFTGLAALATGTDVGVVFALANLLWAIGDVAIGSIDWADGPIVSSHVREAEKILCSGCAVLLLPGSTYPDGSKSVLMSLLELNDLDVAEFLDAQKNKTSIRFLGRRRGEENKFHEEIGAHLFFSATK